MKVPTVSVIMATYNHELFVAEAINSVLSQDGVNIEFLISDDGSADGTKEIVSSFRDPRIKFFLNKINRGACTVINELICHSKGKYIALINSDDLWMQNKLRYQLDFLEANPRIGAIFGRVIFCDKDGQSIDKKKTQFGSVFDRDNRSSSEWLRLFFDSGNCICHPTMLIRRKCYEVAGLYNNRLRQLPDFDMWIRLVKHFEIYISERELINFRILPGENASSITANNSIRTINEHYLIAYNFFEQVTREQLINGFYDLLNIKDIPTKEHLDIEKALLYFHPNYSLGKPYLMIGLIRLYDLLNSQNHKIVLRKDYGIEDKWFQKKMGNVDVLRPRILALASQIKFQAIEKLRTLITHLFSR